MNDIIDTLFEQLNKHNIEYVVLRGYIPDGELYNSQDIDIYVSDKDYSRFEDIMFKNNWYTPKFNLNSMYHKQYFIFDIEKTYKVDVVNHINFSRKHKELIDFFEVIKFRNCFNGRKFYTLNPWDSLCIFLMHIVYDKKEMSSYNYIRYQAMLNDAENVNKGYYEQKWIESMSIFDFDYIKKTFEKNIEYDESSFKYIVYRLKFIVKKIISELYFMSRKKMISIIGVDGTGKSTTINEVSRLLSRHGKIQYMGFTRYTTFFAKRYNNKKVVGLVNNFIETLCVYFEMWVRFIKNRFIRHKITIFDRYVNESYINARGLRKVMVTVLFKYLFPKPKKFYYLYCPVEVSLKRKDDIFNVEQFAEMKKRFDRMYLDSDNVTTFDTSILSSDEIAREIYKDISIEFPDFLI